MAAQPQPHNVVLFVVDGLRPTAVNPVDSPRLYRFARRGVRFANSHSLFPTFTTPNATALATGHYLGDTGDFSNTIFRGLDGPAGQTVVPFIENDGVLASLNQQFTGNFTGETSLLAAARTKGFSTAAVGKLGPVLIQDLTGAGEPGTIVFDDTTGSTGGVPIDPQVLERLQQNSLPAVAPARGLNGKGGDSKTPGTALPNTVQQHYFIDVTTQVLLPLFRERQKPFVLVYWSRDPDGTQHNQGDSLNQLRPGINGPTSRAAIHNADSNLAQLLAGLRLLNLEATTDVVVVSDHGFSTVSKQDSKSYAAQQRYPDVPPGFVPPGFVAIDLAHELQLPLFDADSQNAPVDAQKGQHPFLGNAVIGSDPASPAIVVAANGGSDLLYFPDAPDRPQKLKQAVDFLLKQDYVSGLFVDDSLGVPPGALPLSAVNLKGTARTPTPSIVVNFRSFSTGCRNERACAAVIADTRLQQGQGIHGSFSRADTFNYMAASGPDFRRQFIDRAPASNADIQVTLARLLGLDIPSRGELTGRVLGEALAGGAPVPVSSGTLRSKPGIEGRVTLLQYQQVGKTRYFDAAGFAGRTLGLKQGR